MTKKWLRNKHSHFQINERTVTSNLMAFHSYFLSEILRVLKMYMSKQDSSISEVFMHVNKVTGSL